MILFRQMKQSTNFITMLIQYYTYFYFKLLYVSPFSVVTQKRIRHFIQRYYCNLDINKLVLRLSK